MPSRLPTKALNQIASLCSYPWYWVYWPVILVRESCKPFSFMTVWTHQVNCDVMWFQTNSSRLVSLVNQSILRCRQPKINERIVVIWISFEHRSIAQWKWHCSRHSNDAILHTQYMPGRCSIQLRLSAK